MSGTAVLALVNATSLSVSAAVVLAAATATGLTRVVLTLVIRRLATKRLAGQSTRWNWRIRIARHSESSESLSEIRRQHRIDAAAQALSRLGTVIIWTTAVVVLLHVHGISVGVAVGSAGFIGLILALGAQTSVSDYVSGIHVLLEDRFGEGDDIELVTANGRHLRGTVTGHGMFGTQIQSGGATHHIANRLLSEVTNHSQIGVVTTVEIEHCVDREVACAATALTKASRPDMPALFIDQIETLSDSVEPLARIHLRASRPLGDTDQHHFDQHLRDLIGAEGAPDHQPVATSAAAATKTPGI
jgi:small-conductance mechanosensitive channel